MLKLLIHGLTWKLKVLDADLFKKRFGDCEGITIPETKQMYFSEDELDLEVLEHELMHGYLNGLCLESTTSITNEDFEEIYCEVFVQYGSLIKRQAKWALKELR